MTRKPRSGAKQRKSSGMLAAKQSAISGGERKTWHGAKKSA